ncbi:MAG TPA: polyphosphate kinase 1 [Candidatus Solibacter sp.]|nr:polyphosphate kinase 1 [Candidatus Solibacter sp.]
MADKAAVSTATLPQSGRNGRTAPRRRASSPAAQLRYINRELSWIDFNKRVLAQAEDVSVPLLERAKFLAIASQSLDEFFQVRVAGLTEQIGAGVGATSPDGMSAAEQLQHIRVGVEECVARQTAVFSNEIVPRLNDSGIRMVTAADLEGEDAAWLRRLFEDRIFPVLTPLAVDPAHPFPYISNLSLNLAVLVREPGKRKNRFARVKVPPLLPRFIVMPDGDRFIPVEQVIAAHLDSLFPGMKVVTHHPFRVTRNADLELEEDEADDLLAAIEIELRRHRRFADVVRLEVDRGMSDEILELLRRELEIGPDEVYVADGLLDLGALWTLHALDRPDLKDDPWVGTTQPRLALGANGRNANFFRVLREGDILVHHPYDSFATSVEAFVAQAARDPDVLAIKQTLYRTAGAEGGIIRSLIRAAEAGKQVVALVELKARGDEQANIGWARALEEAGVHVVYGLVGLKTHAKILLVVRQEEDAIRHYAHIGTGNYNAKTATVYEDLGLLTCDPAIGSDLTNLFNHLTGYSRQENWRRLLVAPGNLRASIGELIRAEAAHEDGRIVMKMNSLVDPEIIDTLYAASQSGATVELIVRGICCLRPGVSGLSENITVRSLVGRFLEHSRIYRFGSDARGAEFYIGSADMMPRNLDRRVEVVVPVIDEVLQARLDEILEASRRDDTMAWELDAEGAWQRVPTVTGFNAQRHLQDTAQRQSHPGFSTSNA